MAAGFEGLLHAHEFLALRLLMPLVAGPLALALLHLIIARLPGRLGLSLQQREPLIGVLVILWFLMLSRALAAAHAAGAASQHPARRCRSCSTC